MPIAIEEIRATDGPLTRQALIDGARPRVLRGICRDWPMVALARGSDSAFARELAHHDNATPVDALLMPREAHGVVGYNDDLSGFNYRHFRVTVTQVLERLATYSRQDEGAAPGVAMQSALIAQCLPGLMESHPFPLLDADVQPRLWIGNRVTTPAHFDTSHNLAVVVCGRRRFTLLPPEQVRNLYVGPLDRAPTAAAISLPPIDAVDDPRYPRLGEALAHAQVAELEPGDAIYIPPVWWHHVASLERLNALVNYWWRPPAFPGHVPEPGLDALMHCVLAFRSLPSAERQAWRTLLDHYVFDDADPAAHLPADRRGVLGPLTAEVEARLRSLMQR